MSEMLHTPSPEGGEKTIFDVFRERSRAAVRAIRAGASRFRLAVARHPVSPMLYLSVLALGAGALVFHSTYIRAYAVSIDGVEVALVADTADVDAAVSHVAQRVSSVVGDYDYQVEVTYTPVYSTVGDLTDEADLETYLYETAGAVMDGFALSVNGEQVGVAASEEEIQAVLDRVAAPYLTENTVEYGFVEELSVTGQEMSSTTQFDMDALYALLTSDTVEEAVYTVEKGDTFVQIAKSLGMTVDELSELNPDVVIDKLWIGDELVIQRSVPMLSVWTVENETYEQTIESPVEYTETDAMYQGESKVTVQGEDGLAEVNANFRYVNGYLEEQTVLSTTVLQAATTTEILVGTREKPRTASTGVYIWPVSGHITSRYGTRSGGEFHTGLDIGVSTGTTVKAADGGTVTFAGWKGNYGYLVVITHDNGAQTYYAHNSSLLVSAGDKVYQGQAIARSGATGRATGPHCHFEIRIGGKTVNPLNYLS